jgi:outer membrane protein OmpA-like peptidoglycan-associated protein
MRFLSLTLLVITLYSGVSFAQLRPNLNNWFLAGNIGTTVGHTDVRPKSGMDYINHPGQYIGYIISPEASYHFTHGFGLVLSYSYAKILGNERSKMPAWPAREFNTNLSEIKFMGHLNLGRALSFNLRKNIISPYVNAGVGSTWGRFHAPLSRVSGDAIRDYLNSDRFDTAGFQTWNKNLQVGFYVYAGRYFDLDIRYNYTFYNEDYVDGSWMYIIGNREWDKYSAISVGFRFKFGANNRRTYEHTSWAREPLEEDTSLFNTFVDIEEYDDGTGTPVFKVRTRPTNVSEENLTKIDASNKTDDDMYQSIYNTLMENPDLRDSLLAALAKDLQDNPAFITNVQNGVCIECPDAGEGGGLTEKDVERIVERIVERVIVREGTTVVIKDDNTYTDSPADTTGAGSSKTGTTKPGSGVANAGKDKPKDTNPITKIDEFELRDIYYDLDEAFIRNDASSSLDELAKLLKKYPNLKIELGSHTDCRNSKNYNLALSQKRALAAVNYLVCQGIDRCRLVAKAYGESQLVNMCDCEGEDTGGDCTDAEHQRNRRTTVKILDYNYQKGSGCQEAVEVDVAAAEDARLNSKELPVADPKSIVVTEDDIKNAGISTAPAAGYYVVIGTSYVPKYASALAALAQDKESFDGSGVLYLGNTKYFVYADMSTDYDAAMAKLKAVRCCTRFPDAWIYAYKMDNTKGK